MDDLTPTQRTRLMDEAPNLLRAATALDAHLWDADGPVYDELREVLARIGRTLQPHEHHPDCDYRNSYAAKETAELTGVDVEENSEVFDCNLDCAHTPRGE